MGSVELYLEGEIAIAKELRLEEIPISMVCVKAPYLSSNYHLA